MTREDILNAYQFDANKIIRTPGKFEGEPIWSEDVRAVTLNRH